MALLAKFLLTRTGLFWTTIPLPYSSNWAWSHLRPDERKNSCFKAHIDSPGLCFAQLSLGTWEHVHTEMWVGRAGSVCLWLEDSQDGNTSEHLFGSLYDLSWIMTSMPCHNDILLSCAHHWTIGCLHMSKAKWIEKGPIQLSEREGLNSAQKSQDTV